LRGARLRQLIHRKDRVLVIPEGASLTNAVADLIGDTVLGWGMAAAREQKLFWDSAIRLYARCGLQSAAR